MRKVLYSLGEGLPRTAVHSGSKILNSFGGGGVGFEHGPQDLEILVEIYLLTKCGFIKPKRREFSNA